MTATATATAHAQDECATDADCERLYRAGFRCVTGTAANYCVEPSCGRATPLAGTPTSCATDADCVAACGDTSFCDGGVCDQRVLCTDHDGCVRMDVYGRVDRGWCDIDLDEEEVGVCSWAGSCTIDPWTIAGCADDTDCTAVCGGEAFCDGGTCEAARRCDEDDDCIRTDLFDVDEQHGWCDLSRHEDEGVGLCSWTERPSYFYGCDATADASGLGGGLICWALLAAGIARRRRISRGRTGRR